MIKNRKSKIWIIVLLMLVLVACEQVSSNGEEDTMVSKEWMMEEYGIGEEEISNIDFGLIEEYAAFGTKEDTKMRYPDKESLLKTLQSRQNLIEEDLADQELKENNDYLYLIEENTGYQDFSGQDVKYVALESGFIQYKTTETSPNGQVSVFLDLDEGKAYFSYYESSIIDFPLRARRQIDLSEEDITAIQDLINQTDFSSWELSQMNYDEKGDHDWSFAFELEDGQVVHFIVEDMLGQDNAWNFVKKVLEIDGNKTEIERIERAYQIDNKEE